MKRGDRARVLHVMTVPQSLVFLRGQAAFMRERGYELAVITQGGPELDAFGVEEGVLTAAADIARHIDPLADLRAIREIVAVAREWQPDILHAHTPKGGLLGTLAGALAGVHRRTYHMRGLPSLTASGPTRLLLEQAERVSCAAATRVVAVSHSLREVAVGARLVSARKIEVLGQGSGQGVDLSRFCPATPSERGSARESFEIPPEAFVVGFVGRLTRDKGVHELFHAFRRVQSTLPEARLLVLGSIDDRAPLEGNVLEHLRSDARVHMPGWGDPRRAYSAMDVFVMPTHREGFSNVLLEAGASGLPCVTTTAVGARDAVVPGETGVTVDVGAPEQLAQQVLRYAESPALREEHGTAGRRWVETNFSRPVVWGHLAALYDRQMRDTR